MITEVSVGGIFAILVIREVLNFLGRRGLNGSSRNYQNINGNLTKKIEDLWDWHSPDHDGEQGWKGKQLERILHSLDGNMKENTKTISDGHARIVGKLEELRSELKR